ncbi:MAG TPA: CBS domain-containing protein [Ohtaekwangia sp.]
MDEPPSHSLQILQSGPELYALGFAFFILILISLALAVVEVILLKSKDAAGDKDGNTLSWNLKQVHDQLRLYLMTWKVLDMLTNLSMLLSVIVLFYSLTSSVSLITAILCGFLLILTIEVAGKFFSKGIGVKSLEQSVKMGSRIMKSAVMLCKPVTSPLLKTDSILNRRINKPDQLREEISSALERTIKDDESDQKEILKGIVAFSALQVKEVMHGRADIAALNIGLNFHELLQKINTFGFSRVPVFKNLTDQLEGVLYSKDLLPFLDRDATFEWQKLLRPGFFVSENKRLDSLLKEFQEKRIHIALVLDDQKRVSGIITLEDVIEEIIGDINDEFDEVKP